MSLSDRRQLRKYSLKDLKHGANRVGLVKMNGERSRRNTVSVLIMSLKSKCHEWGAI